MEKSVSQNVFCPIAMMTNNNFIRKLTILASGDKIKIDSRVVIKSFLSSNFRVASNVEIVDSTTKQVK